MYSGVKYMSSGYTTLYMDNCCSEQCCACIKLLSSEHQIEKYLRMPGDETSCSIEPMTADNVTIL